MKATSPSISVVDDDESMRESLGALLRSAGFVAEVFESAEAFLGSNARASCACLVLDVRLEGMTGPELQSHLAAGERPLPIVFITATDDAAVRGRVLARGAVAWLVKPFGDEHLLAVLRRAVAEMPS